MYALLKGSDQVQHHNSHYHRYDQVYIASKLAEHIRNIPNCLQRHNVQVSGMDEILLQLEKEAVVLAIMTFGLYLGFKCMTCRIF